MVGSVSDLNKFRYKSEAFAKRRARPELSIFL